MFAISVRVSPCSARSSPRSVGRRTTIEPSSCSICIRCGTTWVSSPSGPLTWTRPGEMATLTVAGISMGCLPMRLMTSPDEADDLAADPALLCVAGGHEAARGGQDRGAEAAEHARQAVLARVDAASRLGNALEVAEHALAVAAVLQLDDERVEALAALDVEVLDVALVLEQARDLLLHAGGRHLRRLVHRLVGVADPGQHVGDRVGLHLSSPYQLLFVMPGITPWCASSRRQIRHRPNLRNT